MTRDQMTRDQITGTNWRGTVLADSTGYLSAILTKVILITFGYTFQVLASMDVASVAYVRVQGSTVYLNVFKRNSAKIDAVLITLMFYVKMLKTFMTHQKYYTQKFPRTAQFNFQLLSGNSKLDTQRYTIRYKYETRSRVQCLQNSFFFHKNEVQVLCAIPRIVWVCLN